MRPAFLFAAALTVSACDVSDPLGFYPEPAKEVVAPLELTGRVVDAADLLTAEQEEMLASELARLEDDTLAQFVVVTTPSLDGYSIEDYSLRLGRGWGIGDRDRNDGLLLVVAPNERKMRIEVGYGLEGTIDDIFAADVIEEMQPIFSNGRFPEGIELGVDRLGGKLRDQETRKAA